MKYAIGLMSGTSLDGVDASLVEITDERKYRLIDYILYPYTQEIREKILDASKIETSNVQKICSLNFEISHIHVEAIKQLLEKTNFELDKIDFIAYHGQTIWHNPTRTNEFVSSTLQIGDASVISCAFNKMVINNFRTADIVVGGEGAPLVPYALFKLYQKNHESIAFQNIGGIGNVTYLPTSGNVDDVIAFDTGPGNMLIDGLMNRLYSMPFDKDAKVALNGNVSNELLSDLLNDEYYELPYPKSTGREKYKEAYLDMILEKSKKLNLKNEDIIKTITVLTAEVIKYQIDKFFKDFDGELIAAGGGCNNPVIMEYLRSDKYTLKKIDDYNISADAKEAFAFAILGYLRLTNQPSNLRKVTGSMSDLSLGSIILPPVIK